MPYVSTCVGRLFVEDAGEGPPVVLWHSLLCDGGMWHAQAVALRERHRVLVIDGPSHGRSEPRRTPFTLDQCADALVELLDAHAIDRAALVGLSWGGMTAMRVALRHPSRVRALGLFDTSANAETPANVRRYRAMAEVVRRVGPIAPIEDRVRRIMVAPATLREKPALVDEVVRRIRGWDREGLYHAVRAVVVDRRSIAAELPRIRVPTLVAIGEHDHATPRAFSERIAGSIPGARLEVIAGAGHLTAAEQPDAVTALLRGFLAALPS